MGEAIKEKGTVGGNSSSREELFPAAPLKTAETPSSPSLFLNPGKKGSKHWVKKKNLIPGAAVKPLAAHVSVPRATWLRAGAVPASVGRVWPPLGLGSSYSPRGEDNV